MQLRAELVVVPRRGAVVGHHRGILHGPLALDAELSWAHEDDAVQVHVLARLQLQCEAGDAGGAVALSNDVPFGCETSSFVK